MRVTRRYTKKDAHGNAIFEKVEQTTANEDGTDNSVSLTLQRCRNCRTHLEHEDVQVQCACCGTAMCKSCLKLCESCNRPVCSTHRTGFGPSKMTLCGRCLPSVREYERLQVEFEIVKEQDTSLPGTLGVIQKWFKDRQLKKLQKKLEDI
jgi:hypothetical protein